MSTSRPGISVVMPVYNTAPYLRRALDSVCNQTFGDLEILCINDGSTDESPAILAEYAARDPRIRIIDHGANRGVACTMNTGFDAARGEALGIVDSDDAVGKDFFRELWASYTGSSCEIVKGRLVERDLEGIWREAYPSESEKNQISFCGPWASAIYKTDFIRKHHLKLCTKLPCGQDTLFLYCLMGHEPRINFCDTAIYYYFRNTSSVTNSHNDEFYVALHIMIAKLMKQYLPTYPHESSRQEMYRRIIGFLDSCLNTRFSLCDASPYLEEIKTIFADDEFYSPQKSFPFLHRVEKVNDIQELKGLLKPFLESSRKTMLLNSLRAGLRKKGA